LIGIGRCRDLGEQQRTDARGAARRGRRERRTRSAARTHELCLRRGDVGEAQPLEDRRFVGHGELAGEHGRDIGPVFAKNLASPRAERREQVRDRRRVVRELGVELARAHVAQPLREYLACN
jgi:hypothetical protein